MVMFVDVNIWRKFYETTWGQSRNKRKGKSYDCSKEHLEKWNNIMFCHSERKYRGNIENGADWNQEKLGFKWRGTTEKVKVYTRNSENVHRKSRYTRYIEETYMIDQTLFLGNYVQSII